LVSEQVFDLGIDAAKVVVGPPAQGLEEARIESEQEALAVGHRVGGQV
jgi:hypothetical protein